MDSQSVQAQDCPLYVDLDGTLIKQDSFHESLLAVLKRQPSLILNMLWWLWRGKAYFKQQLAVWVLPEDVLPVVNPDFIAWLELQKKRRPLYLATASEASMAHRMAEHFGLFNGVIATSASGNQAAGINMAGRHKLQAIQHHMTEHGYTQFDYAGNSTVDLPIWAQARQAIAVHASRTTLVKLKQIAPSPQVFGSHQTPLRHVIKAMRLSQWSKNGLLFVPLLAAHEWGLEAWGSVMLAFMAFGMLASSTYMINDMLDLTNDRQHPHKRHRPLASGELLLGQAVPIGAMFMVSGLALAAWLSTAFFWILVAYTITTLAYSFRLKAYALVDVLILSGLYSWRLFAGATVASITLSNWLLTVSLFLFLGLALVKRCAELEEVALNAETNIARGRGYHQDDLALLRALGVSSSFATVLVLALYIDSQTQSALYPSAGWLWGVVPIMLFWLIRLWMKATRRQLQGEDPLQFALHDKTSWLVVLAIAGLAGLASM